MEGNMVTAGKGRTSENTRGGSQEALQKPYSAVSAVLSLYLFSHFHPFSESLVSLVRKAT
jgi:hypothetical protein